MSFKKKKNRGKKKVAHIHTILQKKKKIIHYMYKESLKKYEDIAMDIFPD